MTEEISGVGDESGLPARINYPDTSYAFYNRTDPGNSAPLDSSRGMHNSYNHWLFSKTDEFGRTTTYTRDSRRRVTRIDYHGGSAEGSAELFTYHEIFNQVATHTLPSGAVITYTYDDAGRLKVESNSYDGPGSRKEYEYDSVGRVRTVCDARARAEGKSFSTRITYNGRHQVIMVEYAGMANSNPADNPHVTYGYDAYGNCTSITDEVGHVSTYEYDSYRRCISYTEPLNAPDWNGGPNVASRRWDWIYDRYIEGIGFRGAYTHTANEWRVQIEPPFNAAGERRMTARWHDVSNRIVRVLNGWIQRAAPAAIGDWYWSGEGGDEVFTYDENGQKSSYTDPLTRLTTYEYDIRNRPWKTNETVNTLPRTTETLYDYAGNKTRVNFPVEAAGQRSQQWLDYDAFGQPGRFIDERGNTTDLSYCWGPMKKLCLVTTHRLKDGGGMESQPTQLWADPMGRPIRTVFPDGTYEENGYECKESIGYNCDQVRTFRTRKGQIKRIVFDARGREQYHTFDGNAAPRIDRVWDAANRLMSIANPVSTITYSYDDASQVKTESNAIVGAGSSPPQLTYYRYPDGFVAHLGYPDGVWVRHDYTARGQLGRLYDSATGWKTTVEYGYFPDGKVKRADYADNTRTDYEYDGRGFNNLLRTYNRSSGQDIYKRNYYRDERDRITAIQRGTNNQANQMENGRGDHFWYDAEGQLTDAYYGAADPANAPNNPQRIDYFPYDELGNRKGWNYLANRGWMNLLRRDNGLNQYLSWENNDPNPPGHWGSGIFQDDNRRIALLQAGFSQATESRWRTGI